MGGEGNFVWGWPRARDPLPFPFIGVVIVFIELPSIIHLSEHFTYLNEFLDAVGHKGSDNRESTVLS